MFDSTFATFLTVSVLVFAVSSVMAQKPTAEPFGKTKDGQAVEIYTLESQQGLKARIMTRGATLVNLFLPDKNGESADCILGFDDVAGYESEDNQYFGCTTGRVCNRIAKGKFSIDGTEYTLAINNEPNHLHGGVEKSLDKVVWKAFPYANERGTGVRFQFTSPDGAEGYPGNLKVTVNYFVPSKSNNLMINYKATTDKATPVNLTNHAYYNLAGAGTKSLKGHNLRLFCDKYTPADDTLIPTGKIESVEGSPLDFRKMTPITKRIKDLDESPALGYDHNYVVNDSKNENGMNVAAVVYHPPSGRRMRISTTEPGIQFYSGNFLKDQQGKDGKTYAHRSAFCLETQHYPDSVNQASFPTTVLKPGDTYESRTVYMFSVAKKDDNKKDDK